MVKKYKVSYSSFIGFILCAFLIVFVWRFFYVYYILCPFTIMETWSHEMGRGIISLLVGGDFEYLKIFGNGSELTHSSYPDFYFNKNRALSMVTEARFLFITSKAKPIFIQLVVKVIEDVARINTDV
ncbi:MAG: hypothetical protein ACI8RY_001516 [Urechidicola sp.]|jgi:hypothetical protein